MREIKFRTYDPVLGMWPVIHIDFEARVLWVRAKDKQEYALSFDNSPPLQYTGLKDKNGREIYEGDICKLIILGTEEKYNPLAALLVVIEWDNASWGFRHLFPDLVVDEDRNWRAFWQSDDKEIWSPKYFEVIGNIDENPEWMP